MKRFLSSLVLVIFTVFCYAQSCYTETRKNGVSAYNNGQYKDAKAYFLTAKSCPDKPQNNDLDNWIKKCEDKIKANSHKNTISRPATITDTYIKVDDKYATTSNYSSSGWY